MSILILLVLLLIWSELSDLNALLNCTAFQNISIEKNIGCKMNEIKELLENIAINTGK